MRFGLATPVVTCHPDHAAAWERDAGPEELVRIAKAADALGYHHLTCSEHVAIPRDVVPVRGGRYYDPLATLAFLAAHTTRIRLVTHVLVLPYHHPLAIAKRYGTLDRLSGGRVILGVGVGTLEEEFRLLGIDFRGRGTTYEDAIRAVRAAFGRPEPAYAGTHHRFDGHVVDPCGVQHDVPIWLGGRTARSLRRALALGDGWVPFGLGRDALGGLIARAAASTAWAERRVPLDIVLTPDRLLDPLVASDRQALEDDLRRYRDIGATAVNLRFRHRSVEHYVEQLGAFAATLAPRLA